MHFPEIRRLAHVALALPILAGMAGADLDPEWVAKLPAGYHLGAGIQGMVVDAAGVSYVTATAGPSSNTDVLTAAFAPDGSLLWSHLYNGPGNWHDQARGIALGPGGVVHVTGNTPSASKHATVLLLTYDAAGGSLLNAVQYSSAPGTSEHGASVATDSAGNVYIGGGTVGDGGDGLVLKFDSAGQLVWKRTWDGPAFGPYSQDNVLQVEIDPSGDPIAMIHGVMGSLHPDFVVVKYAQADGATVWQAAWGVSGGDFPRDMELDGTGDVYVTGTGIDLTDKYSTIKLRGSDGHLLWQAYDAAGIDDHAVALALDGQGGVYVTGAADPDGDQSNFNDNIYTVKRDATSGALRWTHSYGASCKGCYDVPSDVVVDPAGNVFVAGSTSSAPYSGHVITLVLHAASGVEIERGAIAGGSPQSPGSGFLRFDAAFNLFNGGQTKDPNTGLVEVSVFEYSSLVGGSRPVVYCSAKISSCGSTPTIGGPSALASVSAGAGSYDVTCGPVPSGGNPGLVVYTTHGPQAAPASTPFGFLCIDTGPGFYRVAPAALPAGTGCAAVYTFDFGAHLATQTLDPDLVAGATVDMQAWYRDPASAGAANFSNAMSFILVP